MLYLPMDVYIRAIKAGHHTYYEALRWLKTGRWVPIPSLKWKSQSYAFTGENKIISFQINCVLLNAHFFFSTMLLMLMRLQKRWSQLFIIRALIGCDDPDHLHLSAASTLRGTGALIKLRDSKGLMSGCWLSALSLAFPPELILDV